MISLWYHYAYTRSCSLSVLFLMPFPSSGWATVVGKPQGPFQWSWAHFSTWYYVVFQAWPMAWHKQKSPQPAAVLAHELHNNVFEHCNQAPLSSGRYVRVYYIADPFLLPCRYVHCVCVRERVRVCPRVRARVCLCVREWVCLVIKRVQRPVVVRSTCNAKEENPELAMVSHLAKLKREVGSRGSQWIPRPNVHWKKCAQRRTIGADDKGAGHRQQINDTHTQNDQRVFYKWGYKVLPA